MTSFRYLSFDVYDSCLCRVYARPTDLFIQLARNILPDTEYSVVLRLAKLRQECEIRVNESLSSKEGLTLDKIYRDFIELKEFSVDPAEMLEVELKLEADSIYPIIHLRDLIKSFRVEGVHIIFISDMYLPGSFIQKLLETHGFFLPGDALFVSGDLGLTKRSGALFRHVLKVESIRFFELGHYGDNLRVDIFSALRCGIRPFFVSAGRLSAFEKILAPDYFGSTLLSRIAGTSRRIRISSEISGADFKPILPLVADIISPLVFFFTAWLIRKANSLGIERLYFVSRDGQLPYKIAKKISMKMPTPEIKYLYGSRRVWNIPEEDYFTLDSIKDFFPAQVTSLKSVFNTFHISLVHKDFFCSLLSLSDVHVFLNDDQVSSLKASFVVNPASREILASSLRSARKLALTYLRQEGFFDGKSSAIVDAGWYLNMQKSLLQILRSVDENIQMKGFYLGLAEPSSLVLDTGDFYCFIDSYELGIPLRKYDLLIENLFLPAGHGTVVGYEVVEDTCQPALDLNSSDVRSNEYVVNLHRVVLGYVDQVIDLDGVLERNDEMVNAIMSNLGAFLSKPRMYDVRAVESFEVVHDHCVSEKEAKAKIVTSLSLSFLFSLMFSSLGGKPVKVRFPWIEGSVRSSPFYLRPFFHIAVHLIRKWQMRKYRSMS